jgi:serine/threonine-protein kinase
LSQRSDRIAGSYRLDQRLGRGAWGEVWSAQHVETGARCALKLLHPEHAAETRLKLRFLREALVGRRIAHPGIVRVDDVGEADGAVFIAFERLNGASLETLMRAEDRMPTLWFVGLMKQLGDVLAASHAAGIVHRDLKPANLFIHREEGARAATLKLLDFGVSKILYGDDGLRTQTGSFLGSPRYVSPEHVLSPASVDARSDLWSAGVILFFGLSGTHPHEEANILDLLRAIANEPPASIDTLRPGLDPELRSIVRDCLKPRMSRIASAELLRNRLATVIASGSISIADRLPPRVEDAAIDEGAVTDAPIVPETLTSVTELFA